MFRLQIQTQGVNDVFGLKLWKEDTNSVTVNWGNGQTIPITQQESPSVWPGVTSSYSSEGTYIIEVQGDPFRMNLLPKYKNKITKILEWGENEWVDGDFNFSGCQNLDVIASDTPDLSGMESLSGSFDGCSNLIFTQSSLNSWDTSQIKNISNMFRGCSKLYGRVDNWNVTQVGNLIGAFEGVQYRMGHGNFGIHPLKKWKLSDPSLSIHFEQMTRGSGIIREYNSFIYPSFVGMGVGENQSYLWVDIRFTCKQSFIDENQGEHTFNFYRGITQSQGLNKYTGYNDEFRLPSNYQELPPDPEKSATYSYQVSNANDYIKTPNLSGSFTQSHIIYLDSNPNDVHFIKATYSWDGLTSPPLPGINSTDALRCQRISSLTITETDQLIRKSADVNNSGSINATDAIQIAQYTTQLRTSFLSGIYVLHPSTFSIPELGTRTHPVLGEIPYLNIRIRRVGNVYQ